MYWLFSSHIIVLEISASAAQKYITINVTGKDDLTITCSIINSDQLDVLHLIQLKRESGKTFEEVISIFKSNGSSQINWKDEDLKNRATADGTIKDWELKLFIDKESVQCLTDFTNYTCIMVGVLKSTGDPVTKETEPHTASNIDTCTCMYVYSTKSLILLKLYADLLNDIRKREMFVLFIKLY